MRLVSFRGIGYNSFAAFNRGARDEVEVSFSIIDHIDRATGVESFRERCQRCSRGYPGEYLSSRSCEPFDKNNGYFEPSPRSEG